MSTGIHEANPDEKRSMEEIKIIAAFWEGEDSERRFVQESRVSEWRMEERGFSALPQLKWRGCWIAYSRPAVESFNDGKWSEETSLHDGAEWPVFSDWKRSVSLKIHMAG